MSDHVIEASGLVKRFGERTAVAGVDLLVPAACAFGFLGPNGAGKTTVVRMLLGLTHADGGTMKLLGRPVPADRRAALARVGAIVEEPRFHGHLSGRENLRIAAAAREREATARIGPALERVGLSARADDRVSGYSLGMRQRLGIARCLLADPRLLILDEPTNGLDPAGIREFRALVRDLVDEGRTVFLSSHLLDEIERTCDRVAIIDRGRTILAATVADLTAAQRSGVRIACSEPARAAHELAGLPEVEHAEARDGHFAVVRLREPGDRQTAAVVRALVHAGIDVHGVERSAGSLEERFMEMTTRLEEAA